MEIHSTPEQRPEQQKQPNAALKVVVLVVLIILLIIGILLPIKLVPNAVTSIKDTFSSLFNGSDTVTLSTDKKQVNSGEVFTLSWDGTHKDNGSYVFSYACKPGVRFETSANQPNEVIACDTQYYFSPNDNRIDLTAFSDNNRFIDALVTLSFLSNDSSEVKVLGNMTVTITNTNVADSRDGITNTGTSTDVNVSTTTPVAEPVTTTTDPVAVPVTATPVTPTPSTTAPAKNPTVTRAHRVSNPNGTADLSVRVTAVGYLDPVTTKFVPSSIVNADARAAAQFVVTNNGDKNTGAWNFTATLPTAAHPTYTAYNQPNLGPGDGIVYTLGFDQLNGARENLISIMVDSNNAVVEVSETNNTSSLNIVNMQGTIGGTTPTPSQPTQPSGLVRGTDLVVRVISTGVINKSTGVFAQTNNVNSSDRAAIQFEIQNMGDQASGSYRFTANLPTSDSNASYTSGYQPSLAAGQKTIFTLGFENISNQGNNPISLRVNSYGEVSEVNTGNNQASATIYRY